MLINYRARMINEKSITNFKIELYLAQTGMMSKKIIQNANKSYNLFLTK